MGGKLDGKVAVVTGGSAGIGLGVAKRFADEGAHVFITGRRVAELDAAAKTIGASATAVRADSANLSDLDRLYEQVRARAGRLDIVFANAGGVEHAPLGAIGEAHFDRLFAVNVKGVLFTVQKALPLLSDGGSVILTASTAGSMGRAGFSVYSATKAAVRAFARTWILDLKERQIRVNVISPGPIATPGLFGLLKGEAATPQFQAQLLADIPMGRMGEPDEVGKAAVFLASDDSSFVNGAELFVDGGFGQI